MIGILLILTAIFIVAIFLGFKGVLYLSGQNINNKEGALNKIAHYIEDYDINEEDIQNLFNNTNVKKEITDKSNKLKTLLIYLGGIFIFSGLSLYTSSFWDDMTSLIRVSITLGIGIMLYITTIVFIKDKKYNKSVNILSLIFLPFIITGWHVFFKEYTLINDITSISAFIYIFVAFQYGYLYLKEQKNLFIVLGLFFFYLFLNIVLILSGLPLTAAALIFGSSLIIVGMKKINDFKGMKTFLLLIGILYFYSGIFNFLIYLELSSDFAALSTSLLLIGTKLITKKEKYLDSILEFTGISMFYVSLFNILMGNTIEAVYLIVSGVILYYSLTIKNNLILLASVISFMSFLIYYSNEYFVNSIGWALSLVFFGFVCLGLGTIVINLKKKQK